jgi:hypothetical protein
MYKKRERERERDINDILRVRNNIPNARDIYRILIYPKDL